ncbi:hypothetical protein NVP1160O_73 [Vibrio phage 1.160.O._10N.261.48.B11]|nr:hypothetical protein NVP1160O_73 [Vibrio phage 1.160.O._10N.261.48.B11]
MSQLFGLQACREHDEAIREAVEVKPRFALPIKLTNYGKNIVDKYGDVICKCESQYAAEQIKELIESENL